MAAIPVDPAVVRPVRFDNHNLDTRPCNAAMLAGVIVVEGANGKWTPGNGGGVSKPGVLLHRAIAANYEVTALRGDAFVEMGEGLQALAFGTPVYATATGGLDDLATGNQRIGTVVAGWGDYNPRKLLRLDA